MHPPSPHSRAGVTGQTLHLYLYRRPIHPDHFPLKGRRHITATTGKYELEAWIGPGSHALRFRHGTFNCCELVIDRDGGLPVEGAVTGFACAGEHDFQHQFAPERITYNTAVQSETLSSNLYKATYEDMLDYTKQTDALAHKYEDSEGRKCLSLLDLQSLSKEVHCQGFHLIAATGLVVRTQTIFSHF
jgi:hypothetical protein